MRYLPFISALLVACASAPVDPASDGFVPYEPTDADGKPFTPSKPDLASTPDLTPDPTPAPSGHRRCGWIFTSDDAAKAVYLAQADWFEALHPVWFAMNADGVSVRSLAGADDPQVTAALRTRGAALIPLVASVENAAWLRSMLYDPAKRAAHVKTLVDLAVSRGYDGLDLDYEHLWNKADHDPLVAFVKAFGAAMHAAGKRASMAAPALPSSSTVWDYPALAASLDEVHLMGYDFHTTSSHAGPTAPLGWLDAVCAHAEQVAADKFILAVPNYGISSGAFCPLDSCAARCQGPIAPTTDHMASCNLGTFAAGRIPNCDTAQGRLFFDDAASLAEKIAAAKSHHLRGISYWTVGGEPPAFFETVRKYY